MNTLDWDGCSRIGNIGEETVKKYLETKHKVDDVRHLKCYQGIDVDFLVDDMIALEVKTDTKVSKTGNFFIETCGGGWYEKCRADYLCVYDSENRKLYF